MKVQTYLFFEGRCEEALEFYGKALGAKVGMVMRYKDNPEPPRDDGCGPPAGSADKIMHSDFTIGETLLMASDGMCSGKPSFQGVTLSLSPKTEAEAHKFFDALADGGEVRMPLGKTFYSPCFGMVADRFGVSWMLVVEPQQP